MKKQETVEYVFTEDEFKLILDYVNAFGATNEHGLALDHGVNAEMRTLARAWDAMDTLFNRNNVEGY